MGDYYLVIPVELIGHYDHPWWRCQVPRCQAWAKDEREALDKVDERGALWDGKHKVVNLTQGRRFEVKTHTTKEVIEYE